MMLTYYVVHFMTMLFTDYVIEWIQFFLQHWLDPNRNILRQMKGVNFFVHCSLYGNLLVLYPITAIV